MKPMGAIPSEFSTTWRSTIGPTRRTPAVRLSREHRRRPRVARFRAAFPAGSICTMP